MTIKETYLYSSDYASSIEDYIRAYFKANGYNLLTSTAYELCLVEYIGEKEDVRKVYDNLFNRYKEDYKKLTDFVMQVNMLSWVNDALIHEGYENREELLEFYSELYYESKDGFYNCYDGNDEAYDYFFEATD